jgi:hypothetical protein
MKVTQAMLDAAKRAMPGLPIWGLQEALQAALKDAPEPLSDLDHGCIESMKHNAQRARAEAAEARIAELEALLGKVRAWSEIDRPDLDDLHIILDGKVSP